MTDAFAWLVSTSIICFPKLIDCCAKTRIMRSISGQMGEVVVNKLLDVTKDLRTTADKTKTNNPACDQIKKGSEQGLVVQTLFDPPQSFAKRY